MSEISEYQDEVRENIAAAIIAPNGTQSNQGANVRTQDFPLVPRSPAEYVLGALVTIQTVVNAASGTASSVSASVALDASLTSEYVLPAPGGNPRSYTATRLGSQEVERLCLGDTTGGISYPGSAISSIASGSSSSITNVIFIPVGGHAGAINVQTAPTTQAYGGVAPTATSQFWVRTVSGTNPVVPTFFEKTTTSFSSGTNTDITPFFQNWNISPDFVDFVGTTTSTLQGITLLGADGSVLVNVNSSETTTLNQIQKYTASQNSSTASMVFNLRKQQVYTATANIAVAGTLDLLMLEFKGGASSLPKTNAATPPDAPASKNTGRVVAGNAVVPARSR